MTRIRVVIDTNVLLVSISEKSKYHWLYKSLIERKFEMFVTNEILNEYEEIIAQRWHPRVAKAVLRTLLELRNVHQKSLSFRMNLIPDDADDNKFADCAFANNVHYLVTNDRHFDVLKAIEFPKINVVKINEFDKILNKYAKK
jgi:uncharacterized protein